MGGHSSRDCASFSPPERGCKSCHGNKFTVVTGPPGTGKSQVIVNFIASTNNKAVDVVVDRVCKEPERALIVRTGNSTDFNEIPGYINSVLQE